MRCQCKQKTTFTCISSVEGSTTVNTAQLAPKISTMQLQPITQGFKKKTKKNLQVCFYQPGAPPKWRRGGWRGSLLSPPSSSVSIFKASKSPIPDQLWLRWHRSRQFITSCIQSWALNGTNPKSKPTPPPHLTKSARLAGATQTPGARETELLQTSRGQVCSRRWRHGRGRRSGRSLV